MDDNISIKELSDTEKKLKKLKREMIVFSIASLVLGYSFGRTTGYLDGSRDTIGMFFGIHK